MKTTYDKSFLKSIEHLNDQALKNKVIAIIENVKGANSLLEINQIKKLKGYKTFYRIKTGDYRVGIELIDQTTIRFIIVAHRKDIYKRFP